MNKQDFESFLKDAKHLLEKDKLKKKECYDRGEYFNIFEVMGVETDEVLTHSTFIAHLLNPKGSHGCGDEFLKLFISQLSIFNDWEFSTKDVNIDVEYNIGPISKDYEKGGRLDILIKTKTSDGLKAIIIENKIYASDQNKQLVRYHNYAFKTYGEDNFKILYLTLKGNEPTEDSITNSKKEKLRNDIEQQDFYCISYAVDIIQWLEKCLEKSVSKAVLRETLTQYINTLKKLTNLHMEDSLQQEFTKICKESNNVEVLLWIRNNFDNVINKFIQEEFHPQLEKIAMDMNYELEILDNGEDWLNTSWMRFSFKKEEWNNFQISFEFQGRNLSKIASGFHYIHERVGKSQEVFNTLSSIPAGRKSKCWPYYRYKLSQNWLNQECFEKISNGQLAKEIEEELNELYELIPEGIKL